MSKIQLYKTDLQMIKKFEDYIGEALWKSGIEISRAGVERKENQLPPNNIKELKEIDWGFPFFIADSDLELNGKKNILMGDLKLHSDKIEKLGWRFMTEDDVACFGKINDKINKRLTSGKSNRWVIEYTHHDFEGSLVLYEYGDYIVLLNNKLVYFNPKDLTKRCHLPTGCPVDSWYVRVRVVKDKK